MKIWQISREAPLKTSAVERFIRYAKIDTISDPNSTTFPSTAKQFDLAHILVDELTALGLTDISLDLNGYIMATLPANCSGNSPVIGLIAHMDTSPDLTGSNVNPQFVENYDGGDIVLNPEKGIILSPREFPELKKYIGQTLITTDGTTLLGADDKAGLAAIMAALDYLVHNPQIKHGTIKIGFTPDEEIGKGADRFDVQKFAADFAYTIDGGDLGELQYENFNAASARINIRGRNVHPGTSKDKMINANQIGIEFHNMLPVQMRPEFTAHYDGFFHLTNFSGTVEETRLAYIIREHDQAKFEAKKEFLARVTEFLNKKYGESTVSLEIVDSYYNMKEKILPVFHIIELARQAMLDAEVTPQIIPVRGGTDGARLSFMGLPTPNIFCGSMNAHGRYEYLPVISLEKAVEVILNILRRAAEK